MRYCHFLDAIALVTDEVLVPFYMDMMGLLKLTLTSKQLRNKINARIYIGKYIKASVGIPYDKSTVVKVLSFFKIRGTGNIPYNVLREYGLALKECCVLCLRHDYSTRTDRFENFIFAKRMFVHGSKMVLRTKTETTKVFGQVLCLPCAAAM